MEKQKGSPLLCFLCNGKFKRPKILDCLHSYCEKCLQDMQKSNKHLEKGSIRCPVCGQETPVPNGVAGAKANVFLARLVEEAAVVEVCGRKTAMTCNVCNKHEATLRCCECAMFLCAFCRAFHNRFPASSRHSVYTMEEYRAGKTQGAVTGWLEAPECPNHPGESCRFYCLTCQEMICRDCAVLDRSSGEPHEYATSFETAASAIRKATDALLLRLENKVLDLETSVGVLEEMGPALKKRSDVAKAKVSEAGKKIRQSLEEEEKRLLKQIRSEGQRQLTVLKENQNEASASLNKARYSLKSARQFVQRSTDSEFLWLHSTLVKNIQGLVLKEATDEPMALAFREDEHDTSLGKLTKENITEAVQEASLKKTKGKQKPTLGRSTEETPISHSREKKSSSNKENPPPESEDENESGSEEEYSSSSSSSKSDEPISSSQPKPTSRDTPVDKKKLGASAPKMVPASAPAPKPKDSIRPSNRVLRSSSKANATPNQASPRPTAQQPARTTRLSTNRERGRSAEDEADIPFGGLAGSRSELQRQANDDKKPGSAGPTKSTASMVQPARGQTSTSVMSQKEPRNIKQAPSTYTSAPARDYNPNLDAAAAAFRRQQVKGGEPTNENKAQDADVHEVHSNQQEYPLIRSPSTQLQVSAKNDGTDSDDSDL